MKALFVLILVAAVLWLGLQYYENGKKIDAQQAKIAELEHQVKQMRVAMQQKAQAAQPRPADHKWRLSGSNGGKPPSKSSSDRPERRFR